MIKIGSIELDGYVYIPPMAGVTDLAYRTLCRQFDPNVLLSTEMLSSKSLTHAKKNKKDHKHSQRLDLPEDDKLTGVQIFGHEPHIMAEAAKIAEDAGAKFIDINMGCPVAKLVNGMDGAALMQKPELAYEIVSAVKKASQLPLSVKTRLGWCYDSINAPELAQEFEKLGVAALTIHGRTRGQLYSGKANWLLIAEVVKAVKIPVFANGDVKSLDDAKEILQTTQAAGIAIARATMGKPWLSAQVNHYLKSGERLPEPNKEQRAKLALDHLELLVKYKSATAGIREGKRHVNNYFSGLAGSKELRVKVNESQCVDDIKKHVNDFISSTASEISTQIKI